MKHKSFKFKTTTYKRAVFFALLQFLQNSSWFLIASKVKQFSEKVKLALRPIYDEVSKKFEL